MARASLLVVVVVVVGGLKEIAGREGVTTWGVGGGVEGGGDKQKTISRAIPQGTSLSIFKDNPGKFLVLNLVYLPRPQDIYSGICAN